MSCEFSFITNSNEPRTLNKLVGDRNASRVLASIYHSYLLDGTFWNHAEDIISTYFEDADEENVKRMIKLEHDKDKE